jgi:hypothetical protein
VEGVTKGTKEAKMSPFIDKNPTQFFSVVGAAYVPERHLDSYSRHAERSARKESIWLPDADDTATTQSHTWTLQIR